jgi:hypothetical protein
MKARGPLAVVLALLLVAPFPRVRADELNPSGDVGCVPDAPAPKTSARLRWRSPDGGEGAPGFWISDDAMQRAAVRYGACVKGYTACQVDLSIEKGKKMLPRWKVWTISIGAAIVGGVAIGYMAGRAR